MNVSFQLVLSVGICFGAVFTAFGIFLERLKVAQEKKQTLIRRFAARRTEPARICGAWVFRDGQGRSHHCVLHEEHAADYHRSSTGMGRRVEDGLTTEVYA